MLNVGMLLRSVVVFKCYCGILTATNRVGTELMIQVISKAECTWQIWPLHCACCSTCDLINIHICGHSMAPHTIRRKPTCSITPTVKSFAVTCASLTTISTWQIF